MNLKKALFILAVISVGFMAVVLSTDFPGLTQGGFFGDSATYYCMGLSLALDGDLEYTRDDLSRIYKEYKRGPQGIFLTQNPGSGKLYYAKFFMYPLLCVPFILLFYSNGFYLVNALMLSALLFAGYFFYRKTAGSAASLIFTCTFFLASSSLLYIYWMGPDFTNLFLVFFGYFFWLFRIENRSFPGERLSPVEKLLQSRWTILLSAFFLALAAYSKPTNGLLILPPLVYLAWKRNLNRSAMYILSFGLVVIVLFGLNYYFTEQFIPYGGERRSFIDHYPLEDGRADFSSLGVGSSVSKDVPSVHVDKRIIYNLFYYFFGRFSGIAYYFTPCFFCLLMFLFRPKSMVRWLIVSAIFLQIFTFIVLIPHNYFGGGGCVGNRYFLNIAPLFFFIIPSKSLGTARHVFLWLIWAVFLAGVMIHPVYYSYHPAENAKRWPYTWLPVEMTALNDLPINCDALHRRQPFFGRDVSPHPDYWIYFLDNNTYLKENDWFWVQGGTRAQFILRASFPIQEAIFTLRNGRTDGPNRIIIRKGFRSKKLILEPSSSKTCSFTLGKGFPYAGSFLHLFSVSCEKGFVPRFTDPLSYDERFLGCLCQIQVIPRAEE